MAAPEKDPFGTDPHAAGAKLDHGKLRAALVLGDFSNALTEVCRVGTFGASKYSPSGWLSVPNAAERYEDAMMRHWLKKCSGEHDDPDSGLSHMAHFAWNALALIELEIRNKNTGRGACGTISPMSEVEYAAAIRGYPYPSSPGKP
jgi:hypothetical protein